MPSIDFERNYNQSLEYHITFELSEFSVTIYKYSIILTQSGEKEN